MSFSRDEMERMALDAREQMGATSENSSVDPLKIEIEGVKVVTADEVVGVSKSSRTQLINASTEWSAMSVPLDNDLEEWVIVRNDRHEIERQRVSLLEEFWHIMLGHSLVRIVKYGGGHGRTYHPDEEDEAFYLASATLLPKSAMTKFVLKRNRDLDAFAKKYGVSTQLVEYRIKRLGLWYKYKPKKIRVLNQ
jgi:Zn-dependent peptidase ImmA (M78 family)